MYIDDVRKIVDIIKIRRGKGNVIDKEA